MPPWTPSVGSVYIDKDPDTEDSELEALVAEASDDAVLKSLRAASLFAPVDSHQAYVIDGNQELRWQGQEVVWAAGNSIRRVLDFEAPVLQALFAFFDVTANAAHSMSLHDASEREKLFGPFAQPQPAPWTEDFHSHAYTVKPSGATENPARAICVFLRDALHIQYLSTGQTYIVHVPFRLQKAWAGRLGLVIEREPLSNGLADHLPLLYSLTDPHDELRPVHQASDLQSKMPTRSARAFLDSNQRLLLFSRSDWGLAVFFDHRKATISVWLHAALTSEEVQEAVLRAQADAYTQKPQDEDALNAHATMINPDMTSLEPRPLPQTARKTSSSKKTIKELAERETSMIMHGESDQPEQAGVLGQTYCKRVWQSGTSMALTDFQNTVVHLFDERPDHAVLAVQNKQQSSVYLYHLSRPIPDHLDVSELAMHSCRSLSLVQCTRPALKDLIIVHQGDLIALTSNGTSIRLEMGPGPKVAQIEPIAATRLKASHVDGTTTDVEVDQVPKDATTLQCFEALSLVLPRDVFVLFYSTFIRLARSQRTASAESLRLFSSLIASVAKRVLGIDRETPVNLLSAWHRLLASRRSDAAFASVHPINAPQESVDVSDLDLKGVDRRHLEAILLALHLIHEELTLLPERWSDLETLGRLICQTAACLDMEDWRHHYARQGYGTEFKPNPDDVQQQRHIGPPQSLLDTLASLLVARDSVQHFPDLSSVSVLLSLAPSYFFGPIQPCALTQQIQQLYDQCRVQGSAEERSQAISLAMHRLGWTRDDLTKLAPSAALPLWEAVQTAAHSAPDDWPVGAYLLVGRLDLAVQAGYRLHEKPHFSYKIGTTIAQFCKKTPIDKRTRRQKIIRDQGRLSKALPVFGDRRLDEVARLLQWNKMPRVRIPGFQEGGEAPTVEQQAAFCLAVGARTQALPVGDALFGYMTRPPASNENANVHDIVTKVYVVPLNVPIQVTSEVFPPERLHWPDFHAGVASALERAVNSQFDYTEISFNRPSELNARHAGYLFGLGLTGQIRSMAVYQAFSYLDPKHELTSIGVILGLAAAFVGTGDAKISSVLAVHLSALHPAHSADLQLSMLTQAAGILGLGLLYLGTKKRSISDTLLSELAKITVQNMEQAEVHRETYALMTGFAYGMVMLCEGKSEAGQGDASLLYRFRTFIEGDGQSPLPGSKKGVQPAIDVTITSPAAAVALALTYLGTCRQDVMDLLEIPQSASRLDYIRPGLILHRIISRALVALPKIECTKQWIDSLVPRFLLLDFERNDNGVFSTMSSDNEAAYWSVIAGGCFAIGLKFAGTASADAHALFLAYYDKLCRILAGRGHGLQQRLRRHALQNCINTIILALCIIFAGTGDLDIMRRLRVYHGKIGDGYDHGTHMAMHMALGLLFFGRGRYTLGSSPLALAAMYCAFYPSFPPHSSDNRAHLQAARHLWTLATEPRCLIARDVVSGQLVQIPFKLRLFDDQDKKSYGSTLLAAPSLFPNLERIHSFKVDSPRYYPVELNLQNARVKAAFIKHRTIYVQKHAGSLGYDEDPSGVCGVDSIGSEAYSTVFNFGTPAQGTLTNESQRQQSLIKQVSDPKAGSIKTSLLLDGQYLAPFDVFSDAVNMECLREDKMEAANLYHQIFAATHDKANSILGSVQVEFIRTFYASLAWRRLFSSNTTDRLPLINRDFVEFLRRYRASVLSAQLASERSAILGYFRGSESNLSPATCRALQSLYCPPYAVVQRLRTRASEVLQTGLEEERAATREAVMLVMQKVLEVLQPPMTEGNAQTLAGLIVDSAG